MHKIIASFEVVSPMFIAGYDSTAGRNFPSSQIDIRPTAIKGALRFWWRALRYAPLRANCNSKADALKQLHQEEQQLFGSAASEGKSGQSNVLLRVSSNVSPDCVVQKDDDQSRGDKLSRNNGVHYLLGMGLYHKTGLVRPYIKAGAKFTVQFGFKPSTTSLQIEQVRQAIEALGLLGALGSRARKGFGSIQLVSWQENDTELPIPQTVTDYQHAVARLIEPFDSLQELPPFSAFSAYTMADISLKTTNAVQAIDALGKQQQLYRSYGQNKGQGHELYGRPALQLFADDHDLLADFLRTARFEKQPRRIVFGLPHPVRFSSLGTVPIEFADKNKARRASPLLVHLHQIGGEVVALQTLIGAEFAPYDAKIKFNRHAEPVKPVDWTVITDYLTKKEFVGNGQSLRGFEARQAVFKGSKL